MLNLPELYAAKDFSNFDQSKISKSIFASCKNFNSLVKKSLVLFGNVGTGKTHLAVSIAKNLPAVSYTIKSGMAFYEQLRKSNAFFLVSDEFFQNLNDNVSAGKSKLDLINHYLSYDLLIFDDLSSQNFTPSKNENLYLLINRAYLDNKRLIITTNFTPEILESIDERVTSRLNEMANFLLFNGKDFRK